MAGSGVMEIFGILTEIFCYSFTIGYHCKILHEGHTGSVCVISHSSMCVYSHFNIEIIRTFKMF